MLKVFLDKRLTWELLQFGFMVVASWKLVGNLEQTGSRQAHPEHIRGYPDPRGGTDIRTIMDGYPASANVRPTLAQQKYPKNWLQIG
jgi:hypothetical protein